MKYTVSALVLAIASAGAAVAYAPQLAAPIAVAPAQPAYVATLQPRSFVCDLQLFEPSLVARANPARADSWTLSIDAPGFVNSQSGPVSGLRNQLKPVTRLYMGGIGVQSVAGGQFYGGSPTMPHPFYAELNVYDVDGELVCRDVIDLPELD